MDRTSPIAALPAQVPIGVRAGRGPDGPTQEAGELDDRGALGVDVTVGQTRADHRQRVLVDDLLLEHLRVRGRAPADGASRSSAPPRGSWGILEIDESTVTRTEYHVQFGNLDVYLEY